MADPTASTSTTSTISAIDSVSKFIDNATKNLINFVSVDLESFKEKWNDLGTMLNGTNKDFKNLTNSQKESAGTFALLTSAILKSTNSMGEFGFASTAATTSASLAIQDLETRFGDLGNAIKKIPGLGTIADGLKQSGITGTADEVIKKFATMYDEVNKLQSNMMHMFSSTGMMNREFANGVPTVESLNGKMSKLSEVVSAVADSSGFSTKEVFKFASQLGTIPDALNQSVSGFTAVDAKLTALDAALKLSTGSGQDLSKVVNLMGVAFNDLGRKNIEKQLEYFALINKAAQELGTTFDDVSNFSTSLASSLKYIGDNSDASINVLARYSKALQDTGLSAKSSQELISGMVESVGHLSTGTKAFLALNSGKAGGLQGAFQIDKMLREGKIDEVTKMVESQLKKQMGGRIVSLDQASQSQGAAAQYQKQLSLLQSGAFGGLVKGEDQAKRLLDAMAKGIKPTDLGKDSGGNALKSTMATGNELQKQQVGFLSKINNGTDSLVNAANILTVQKMRNGYSVGAEESMRAGRDRQAALLGATENESTSSRRVTGIDSEAAYMSSAKRAYDPLKNIISPKKEEETKNNNNVQTLDVAKPQKPQEAITPELSKPKPKTDTAANKPTTHTHDGMKFTIDLSHKCPQCGKIEIEKITDEKINALRRNPHTPS